MKTQNAEERIEKGEKKPITGGAWPLGLGLGLALAGIFIGASLVTHDSHDPGAIAPNYPVRAEAANACGLAGAYLSGHLLGAYGAGAFCLVPLAVIIGLHAAIHRRMPKSWSTGTGLFLIVAAVSAWASISSLAAAGQHEQTALANFAAARSLPDPGGMLGNVIAPAAVHYLGRIGAYIVVLTALLAGLLLAARGLTVFTICLVGRGMAAGARRAAVSVGIQKPNPAEVAAAAAAAEAKETRRRFTLRTVGEEEKEKETPQGAATEAPVRFASQRAAEDAPAAPAKRTRKKKEPVEAAPIDVAEALGRARPEATTEPAAEEAPAAAPAPEQPVTIEDAEWLPADFKLPDMSLLEVRDERTEVTPESLRERGKLLVSTLKEFRIDTRLVQIDRGPTVTLYELALAAGIPVGRIHSLQDNIAMAMRSTSVRIVAPIPGKDTIGIEVPNIEREIVRLRPVLEEFGAAASKMAIPVALGRDASGAPIMKDLAHMPHMLVAGETGSGKSVCLNAILVSILMTKRPDEVKLLLVDPKMVELTSYAGVPHLITPIVTDMKRSAAVFEWAVEEMERRFKMLYALSSEEPLKNIESYNALTPEERMGRAQGDANREAFRARMPYLVVIVDEFADLMSIAPKETEYAITRLAQKSRAVGLHIVLATQRPSVDVITGLIKTNMPMRIAFRLPSRIDSRTILNRNGAETLVGRGDMLIQDPGTSNLQRAKGALVEDHEIGKVVRFLKKQADPRYQVDLERLAAAEEPGWGDESGAPSGGGNQPRDERFDEAAKLVLATGRASATFLQRRMSLGFARAAKIVDQMAEAGIVGEQKGAKDRDLLITLEAYESGNYGANATGEPAADVEEDAETVDAQPAEAESDVPEKERKKDVDAA
jgi:DNA segregation ATPase FtsK/SpoIIIE, S-DNA-T family